MSEEEFSKKEQDLPLDLQLLISTSKLYVHWLPNNSYVHKRHEIFKYTRDEDCVFFIDDDVRYADNLIKNVMKQHEKYQNCIICYNSYPAHKYSGKHILYNNIVYETTPQINVSRWCGQSMIPSNIYPKHILSDEYQSIRNIVSPISDECWFQPWTVWYDIPILHLRYDWGRDIDKNINKFNGLCKSTHEKCANGLEKRDNWLFATLTAFPYIYEKYKQLFKYDM